MVSKEIILKDLELKPDEEVINLLVLSTEAYAVEYYRMKLDEAYKHKQIAWVLREELKRRLASERSAK